MAALAFGKKRQEHREPRLAHTTKTMDQTKKKRWLRPLKTGFGLNAPGQSYVAHFYTILHNRRPQPQASRWSPLLVTWLQL